MKSLALLLTLVACTTPASTNSSALTGVTVTTVHQFLAGTASDGAYPRAPLIVGPDGRLYGTTEAGGSAGGGGTVFAVGVDGSYTVLHAFTPLVNGRNFDGAKPLSAVSFGADGDAFGTTELGGEGGNPLRPGVGVMYRIAPDGSFYKEHDFGTAPASLVNPIGGLVPDGVSGFIGSTTQNNGSVYRWSAFDGVVPLYTFRGRAADGTNYGGLNPYSTPVVGTDGALYGMDYVGGKFGHGCIYKIDPATGVLKSLTLKSLYDFPSYTFVGNTDNTPLQSLYVAPDGSIWGLTEFNGENGSGMLFRITGDYVTVIHEFGIYSAQSIPRFSSTDGLLPISTLVQAPDGWLYFTTFYGGDYGVGSIQRIRPDGRGLEQVFSFRSAVADPTSPGAYPYAGLTVGSDGALYGTTFLGGAGYGAVYRLEVTS